MILPFGNLSSFQYQKKFLDEIKTMTNTDTLTSDIKSNYYTYLKIITSLYI